MGRRRARSPMALARFLRGLGRRSLSCVEARAGNPLYSIEARLLECEREESAALRRLGSAPGFTIAMRGWRGTKRRKQIGEQAVSTADDARERARNKLLAAILERAASEAEFRAGLLADPKRTINDAFGISIPEHLRIRFVEKEADVDILVVLPNLIDPAAELAANDLEAVSGGQSDGNEADGEANLNGSTSPW
jgi:hypothetical protein